MDNVIFLDFDGVMMCGSHCFPSKYHEGFEFHPKSVENLKAIINQTGAKIVVTSTYRRMYEIEKLRDRFMAPYGLSEVFLGKTPTTKGGRGAEIKAFIELNQIKHFVIIDDLPITGYDDHFLQTHPFEGITERIKNEAVKILYQHDV